MMNSLLKSCTGGRCWCDVAGVAASGVCMVHCLAMPLVVAYLPLLGVSWLADHRVHQWMAAGCAILAISAFVPGHRQHRRSVPLALGTIGIGMLTWAALNEPSGCCTACAACRAQNPCLECSTGAGENKPKSVATCADSFRVIRESVVVDTAWLTPLGGCLLLLGHVANARWRACYANRS